MAGGCLYTMSVHYMQGLSAQHLFGVSMVSNGRHPDWGTQPPLGQTEPSSRLKIGTLARPLPAFKKQRGSIRDGHIGGEQSHIPPGPYGPAIRDG